MKPSEVASTSAEELASFVENQYKRRKDDMRAVAKMTYAAGLLGSMALQDSRPTFEEVFPAYAEEKSPLTEVEKSRLQMIAFAENLNRLAKKDAQKAGDEGGGRSQTSSEAVT